MDYKTPTPVIVSKNMLSVDIDDPCWKQQELRVEKIQAITKGKGAVLAMLDDGVGRNNELFGLEIDRYSYFDDSVSWKGNHSTFGVTVICGKNFGIFPEMTIVSKQVLNPATGTGGSKEIASAIIKAAEMGIQTINLSLGSDRPDPEIEKALKFYCSNGINIATIAAGNDGPKSETSDWPANYAKTIKGVLSVAATQIDKQGNVTVAMFSSRGIVSIGAPGAMLKSMDNDDKVDFVFGTSFSAPIVGGAVAAARTLINRSLYQDEILDIIEKTSKKIDNKENVGNGSIRIPEIFTEVMKLKEFIPKKQKISFLDTIKKLLGL